MTEHSARFGLPFILPGQAQKEVFHNEALVLIDMTLHPCVEGEAGDPPEHPAIGESWIVGATPTGAWASRASALASWTGGGWRFTTPIPGMIAWDRSASWWLHWAGSEWSDGSLPASALKIGGQQVVGARLPDIANPSGGTIIDTEARTAVAAVIATLKSHGLID